jgi:tubby-related protein 1
VQAAQGRLLVLRNRAPRWCAALGAYTLHFNGRVTEASVKNFQLEAVGGPGLWATKGAGAAAASSGSNGGASAKARGSGSGSSSGDGVVLQFGRVSADAFTLDYAWPMTPVQAFAIALTSLDQKIAVE